MEQAYTDRALSHPQCPTEPNMSEVTVIVALLLIFLVLHGTLAALERGTTSLSRQNKRVVIATSGARKARNRGLLLTRSSTNQSIRDSQQCSPAETTGTSKKTVQFAEVTSVQRIQPVYTPDDFYNDPS